MASLVPLGGVCATKNSAPAPRLEQSYILGVGAYTPAADVERMDASIRSSRLTVPQMASLADQTRSDELNGYRSALIALKQMGAPQSLTQPYLAAIQVLQRPVAITDRAKEQVPGDTMAQRVWSTLDEADRIAPQDGGGLAAWVKLSRGRDALWAYHLGNLAAVLRSPIAGKFSDLPLINGSGALASTAPAATPAALVSALTAVAEEANRHKVTSDSLAKLDSAITSVFGSGPLP